MSDQSRQPVALVHLDIADASSLWKGIGFAVFSNKITVGTTQLNLAQTGRGITGWGLSGATTVDVLTEREGIPTVATSSPVVAVTEAPHPNGATHIDHVVLMTSNLARTQHSLVAAGMTLRRTREAGSRHQCFYRLGEVILEVVGDPASQLDEPAILWGLICTVSDLKATATAIPNKLGRPKPAVQASREIAIVSKAAGLSVPCGFLSS